MTSSRQRRLWSCRLLTNVCLWGLSIPALGPAFAAARSIGEAAAVMESRRRSGELVFVGILVAACLTAVGFGAWSLAVEARTEAAIAGAVILLALAQLATLMARLSGDGRRGHSRRDMVQAAADMGREVREVTRRVGGLEGELRDGRDDSARQIAALERTVAALAAQLEPEGIAAAGPDAGEPERNDDGAGGMALYLQPIVRLASGQTCYYRASHGPTGPGGEACLIARVVAVLRHLKRRGRAVGVFCPLTAAAFADARFLRRLVKDLRRNSDVAGKLVIEISQADLARLSQAGMQGLAWLAELGATFSLAQASPEGPDLAALRQLGFQFVDIDLKMLPATQRDRREALWAVAGATRQNELTFMAGPVTRADEVVWLQAAADLGHGPHFARPRRVRADFGDGDAAQAAAA